MKYILYSLCAILLYSCGNNGNKIPDKAAEQANNFTPPPAGTLITADSVKIPDALNDFYFSVRILSNEHSRNGSYDVKAVYGPNEAASSFTFPKGGSGIMPVLKKGAEPFTYIIGFYWDNDPTFYDYYLVEGQRGQIKMKYMKAYSFQ